VVDAETGDGGQLPQSQAGLEVFLHVLGGEVLAPEGESTRGRGRSPPDRPRTQTTATSRSDRRSTAAPRTTTPREPPCALKSDGKPMVRTLQRYAKRFFTAQEGRASAERAISKARPESTGAARRIVRRRRRRPNDHRPADQRPRHDHAH
jgi:hypothetical protein